MSVKTQIYTDVVYGPDYYPIDNYEFTGHMIKIGNVTRHIFELIPPDAYSSELPTENETFSNQFSSSRRYLPVFWVRDGFSLKNPIHSKLWGKIYIQKILEENSKKEWINLLKYKAVFLIDK